MEFGEGHAMALGDRGRCVATLDGVRGAGLDRERRTRRCRPEDRSGVEVDHPALTTGDQCAQSDGRRTGNARHERLHVAHRLYRRLRHRLGIADVVEVEDQADVVNLTTDEPL